jgi:hypothetical protein
MVLGSVANTGVTGKILEVWQTNGLANTGRRAEEKEKGLTQRAQRQKAQRARRRGGETEKRREVRDRASWSVQFKNQSSTPITKCLYIFTSDSNQLWKSREES